MAKATDKQISYINALQAKLPEDQRIGNGKVLVAINDRRDGISNASKMIDELKAKVAALPQVAQPQVQVTAYTPAEDAATQPSVNERRYTGNSWYYTRNGAGRYEQDNQ